MDKHLLNLDYSNLGIEHPIGSLVFCDIKGYEGIHKIESPEIGWFYRDCPRLITE